MSSDRNPNNGNGWLATAGAAAAGLAAGLGLYWLSSGKKSEAKQTSTPNPPKKVNQPPPRPTTTTESTALSSGSTLSGLVSLINRLNSSPPSKVYYSSGKVGKRPPDNPSITNLNGLLADIYVRFIQLRDDDFQLHYNVFDNLFRQLHERMKEVDLYYNKYSSTCQFAGSHYDNLRIKKPDEFDMDIVIRLPLNISEAAVPHASDIVIEPRSAGYVHLKMGTQFQNLPMRDGAEWETNKAAYRWLDENNYLLRTKFMDWWKKVVNKALNKFQCRNNIPIFFVNGVEYEIHRSSSGPAMTLLVKNPRRGFQLDVDLVPALKFPETRWPISPECRGIPAQCRRATWLVVGKEDRAEPAPARSWRLALHNQERGLMHNSQNLRQAVRLLKKLRDEMGMKKIASYYVKTLFFWEIVHQSEAFWRNNPAFLFTYMVKKLHAACVNGNIPYFWNQRNNLIGNVDRVLLSNYAAKLVPLMQILENPAGDNYRLAAKYLLSDTEYKYYKEKFLS